MAALLAVWLQPADAVALAARASADASRGCAHARLDSASAARSRPVRLAVVSDDDDSGPIEPLLSLTSGPGVEDVPLLPESAGDPRLRQFDVGPFASTIGVRDGDWRRAASSR